MALDPWMLIASGVGEATVRRFGGVVVPMPIFPDGVINNFVEGLGYSLTIWKFPVTSSPALQKLGLLVFCNISLDETLVLPTIWSGAAGAMVPMPINPPELSVRLPLELMLPDELMPPDAVISPLAEMGPDAEILVNPLNELVVVKPEPFPIRT